MIIITMIFLFFTTVLLLCYRESYFTRDLQIISIIFPQVFGFCEAPPIITFNTNSLFWHSLPASQQLLLLHVCVLLRRVLLWLRGRLHWLRSILPWPSAPATTSAPALGYGRWMLPLMLLHPTLHVGFQADAKLPGLLSAQALPFCVTFIK